MLYSVDFHPSRPLTEEDLARTKAGLGIHTENIPGTDHAVRNRGNDYLIDRALQASGKSYTGMKGFGTQDCAIQESMGPIADRASEHLLASRRGDRQDPAAAAADAEGPRGRQAAAGHESGELPGALRPVRGKKRRAVHRRHGAIHRPRHADRRRIVRYAPVSARPRRIVTLHEIASKLS